MKIVDDFLNNITMYKLVLYFLIVLAAVGLVYSFFGVLPYNPIDYVFSFTLILVVSWITNRVFAYVFEAPTNVESVWISALILGLIITPPASIREVVFIGWAAVLAMALKYIIAIGKKHIFNPVAISVAVTAFAINGSASWWVGTTAMMPVVALGGFLVIRKIRRWDMALSFISVAIITIFGAGLISGSNPMALVWRSVTDTPLFFFTAIMITEPLTSPPTRILRIIYGAMVGILFAPQFHLGSFYATPETALVIGNVFSYIVSPKYKLLLTLKKRIQVTPDTFDFVFDLPEPIKFTPGQYMEITVDHSDPDSRGNRRYLSLASSPTESELRLGVKFGDPPSSFKRSLYNLSPNQKIVASQLIGDFTLPSDPSKKLVMVAGGIGITPFRSILKYLIDTNQKRDIVVIYTASNANQFAYKDVLTEAQTKLGIKVIFVDTGKDGHMDAVKLSKAVPDYVSRTFYISGSHTVVEAFEEVATNLGIPKTQIVTDYFPGFA